MDIEDESHQKMASTRALTLENETTKLQQTLKSLFIWGK